MMIGARSDGKVGLKLLSRSPLDEKGCGSDQMAVEEPKGIQHWVPSRFNVRATTEDGQLILWNSMSSALSVFKAAQIPLVTGLLGAAGFEAREEGMPGYLVERGYLVKKGTDEMRVFRHKFGKQHYRNDLLELILLSSEDCNFRCTYCYEDFARGTMLPGVRQGIKRLVEGRIKQLRRLRTQWFGGEPLYGLEAIRELGPFFTRIAEENGVAYSSHITTNGYLLTPDVVGDLLKWKISGFQVTLDGVPEDHDCSRPTRDGQGSFAQIFANVAALARREDDFRCSLRINFGPHNHQRLGGLVEMLEKHVAGDNRFRLDPHAVGRWGGDNDAEIQVCGEDEKEEVLREMKDAAAALGLRVATLKDMNGLGGQVCYAARPYNLLIGASGKVMKCTVVLDKEDHNVVGHLSQDGELTMNEDRMALWTEPTFERDTQCQKCVVLPSCQGISCPLPRIREEKRPCVPTRTKAKKQLQGVLKFAVRKSRKREVVAANAPAASAPATSAPTASTPATSAPTDAE